MTRELTPHPRDPWRLPVLERLGAQLRELEEAQELDPHAMQHRIRSFSQPGKRPVPSSFRTQAHGRCLSWKEVGSRRLRSTRSLPRR
jgi:hypothetical protein